MPITTTPFKLFEPFETNSRNVVRRRSLRYDINALADFEQLTGMGFGQLMSTKAVFATARAMLWAGLKHEDRTLTVEQVGLLLSRYIRESKGSIDEALTVCFEAANDQGAFGEPEQSPAEGQGDSDAGNVEGQPQPQPQPTPSTLPQLTGGPETGGNG